MQVVFPKYLSLRAALLHEKLTWKQISLFLGFLLVTLVGLTQIQVMSLQKQLRTKEYILAPGIQNFAKAVPGQVPDEYLQDYVTDMISQLGNIHHTSIEKQYEKLTNNMAQALAVQFQAESAPWIAKVIEQEITEVTQVFNVSIETKDDRTFLATANTQTDTYSRHEHLGSRPEVVQLIFRLLPPEPNKRWSMELTSLARMSHKAYDSQKPKGDKR